MLIGREGRDGPLGRRSNGLLEIGAISQVTSRVDALHRGVQAFIDMALTRLGVYLEPELIRYLEPGVCPGLDEQAVDRQFVLALPRRAQANPGQAKLVRPNQRSDLRAVEHLDVFGLL